MEPLAAGDPRQVGGYRLRARLGAGGMGQVFLGYSPAGRAVAVKVIHRELARDDEFRTRFRREVAAARAVSGAYTAPVTAAGPDDDPPWLATVFVPGPSLAEAVAAAGPLPAATVWKLTAGLVEALQAVHSCGLVHRDLKPANVLLALDGPRLIDFGISRAMEKTAMTSTGMIVGTPSFMSPEQAQGLRVGPASDVFSLGGVIVFAATGWAPFGSGPQASMLYRVVHAAPALDEVPGGLRELAAACLAKEPADRPGLATLVDATAAGRAPDEGDALASFWPVPVTGLIRSHQARLTTEMREGTPGAGASAGPVSTVQNPSSVGRQPGAVATAAVPGTIDPGTTEPGTTGPATTGPATTGPATTSQQTPAARAAFVPGGPSTVGPETAAAGVANGRQAPPPAAGRQPTVLADTPAAGDGHPPGTALSPGPAMPADWVVGGPPAGGAGQAVTRRRVLFGLAVVAGAGLAGAGWELSRGSSPGHPAGSAQGGRGSTSPAPEPSASGSTAAQHGTPVLWRFPTDGMVAGIALTFGRVIAGSSDGKVYGLVETDGFRLWDFRTGGPVGSGIAAAGRAVYAGSGDGKVYALNASDGTRLWDFATGDPVPSAVAVAGGAVYASSENEMVYALRASDGAKLWGVFVGGGVTKIAVAGNTVFVSGAAMVRALRASDGSRLWDSPTGIGGAWGIAAAGRAVYAGSGDGKVYALRASDGTRLWDFRAGGPVQSGIATAAGVVYVGSGDGMVHALRASDGTELWHFRTSGSVASGIAMNDGIVYAGSNDYTVRALHAGNGSQLWSFMTGGPVESQIAAAGGVAYLGGNDGKVYALKGWPA